MWFLYITTWIALILQIILITLAVAAGLYYLAELVEEYTVITAKFIKGMLGLSTLTYLGLWIIEGFPNAMMVFGLISNLVYASLLCSFPFISLSSLPFIGSCVVVFINHYLAFQYFATEWHPFTEVLAFFTICVWLVPFTFFVSLSASENVLPTTAYDIKREVEGSDDVVTNYFKKRSRRYGLLSFFDFAKDSVLPQRNKTF